MRKLNRIQPLPFLLAALVFCGCVSVRSDAELNVRQFGARGDGRTLDSPAIQKALEACAQAGGGIIRLPRGVYLCKPLFLRGNNIHLTLDRGAVLQGTSTFSDYQTATGPAGLINAARMTNVVLDGAGVIDGAGASWWPAVKEAKRTGTPEPRRRPKMVNFHACKGLTVRGLTLRNSPSFHLVPVDCEDVVIDGVSILAPGDSPNTDAIDPGSCSNVLIVNCILDVGDDNVAIKAGHPVAGREFCCQDIVVSNCVCRHGHGISIGSETSGGVTHFSVLHCTFDGTVSGIRIKTTRSKGGRVENILYKDLSMHNVTRPIDISCYYPKVPASDPSQPVGPLTPFYSDIRIEHLTGDCPASAGLVVGLPESLVRGLTLSNIHLQTQTGLLVRNAADVTMKDVEIEVRSGPPLILENATVN